MYFPPSQLDPATVVSIRDVVARKMQNRECFFLLDVTNEVKRIGYGTTPPSNFGSHSVMRPTAEDAAKELAPTQAYSWAILDVKSGNEQAYLYFPDGTNVATIQSHVNRPVSPLVPVEVWASQVSMQASGIQGQASKTATSTQSVTTAPAGKTLGQHIRSLLSGS